ncbi:hypothetical protein [Pseudomonas sp. FEN]|uniref:hypothetical protein n=1 Tax=Pseudomonas sp. FEN TaxID=2767468 RepID=UPI001CD37FD9|nr:hypothetical protein [Pseudomonas sp. FEN]
MRQKKSWRPWHEQISQPLVGDLHAERVATWEPAALQVNINQRQRLVDEAKVDDYVQIGDKLAPFTLLNVEGGELNRDLLLADGPAVLIFSASPAAPHAISPCPITSASSIRAYGS